MKIYISLFIFALMLFACSEDETPISKKRFENGMQIPIIDSTSNFIGILAPDTVLVGDEYCAKIYLTSKNYVLLHPYVRCDYTKSLVDTSKEKLNNCDIELGVENDTIIFCVTPGDTSVYINYYLNVLTVDSLDNYYLLNKNIRFFSKRRKIE